MKRILYVLCLFFMFLTGVFGEQFYTVRSGDTLYSIAKRHGITVDELQSLNKAIDPRKLKAGIKLRLEPVQNTSQSTPAPTGNLSSEIKRLEKPFPCAQFPPSLEPVKSSVSGRVVFRSEYRGLGQVILIENSQKTVYGFGKMDKIAVNLGQEVQKGQNLGTGSGREGVLFFVYQGQKILDPFLVLR